MRVILLMLLITVSNYLTMVSNIIDTDVPISKEKAIKIATSEALKIGLPVEIMKKKASKHGLHNPYFKSENNNEEYFQINSILNNKFYWVVHIFYFPPRPGGEITVFIDCATGEILFSHRGK